MPKPFDGFAKQLLDELLSPSGEVTTGAEIQDEPRQIDVWFTPDSPLDANRQQLGLLGRMAAQPCLLEPYSSRPDVDRVRSCIVKLFITILETRRTAKREQQPQPPESELPHLWIISPFNSPTLLSRFGGTPHPDWPEGVHFAADALRTGFITVDRLPETPDTLWLRLLGRGSTLTRAVAALLALDRSDSQQSRILQSLASAHRNIVTITNPDEEDRELIMALSPAFLEWEQRTRQEEWREAIAT